MEKQQTKAIPEAEAWGAMRLPAEGYDATLCPNCVEHGDVYGVLRPDGDGWMIRRRRCTRCGFRWGTVELYVSQKHRGNIRHDLAALRMVAFEVDALGDCPEGPIIEKKKGDGT